MLTTDFLSFTFPVEHVPEDMGHPSRGHWKCHLHQDEVSALP